MRKPGLTGAFWPSDEQERLLQAALLEGDDAVRAWNDVRSRIDIERLEQGSYSLLPLVYRQLHDAGSDDPLVPLLKGIYRHTWSKNQLLLQELGSTVETLKAAGVDVLIVGGPARLQYYAEPALRTMTEFELLCRPGEAEQALSALGWADAAGIPARVLRARSSLRVEPSERPPFGLHWRLLPEFPAGSDEDFWAAARKLALENVNARALAPTDELLHALAGGARSALWANVQWIADAAMILRGGAVDWDRFVQRAEAHRATIRSVEALRYLAELLAAPVPPETLARLERFPVTRRDVIAHRLSASGGPLLGELPWALAGYVRSSDGPLGGVLGLPAFLRDAWNVDRSWRLPLVAARKGAAAIAARRNRRGAR